MADLVFPVRINKYLAAHKYCTRREADALVEKGLVLINGTRAVLGSKVGERDTVEVRFRRQKQFRYFAYNKPRGVITHSPQGNEKAITDVVPLKGVHPVGRLDKDSSGLIILTDDGRITDALLSPESGHEKEYEVECADTLPGFFKKTMESGVDIEGYRTKPCTVRILDEKKFSITLTEGKKHQIRRMCAALGQTVRELKRVRVMNISLGDLKRGEYRPITGKTLETLLSSLDIPLA